ncbi:MAG: YhcH/YjgK/YiaL family protein [Bacilli bacterium]
MIVGSLKILNNYKGLSKALDKAIEIVLTKKFDSLVDGLNVIDEDITITKLTYVGKEKDKAIPEEHFEHLDMQVLLKGNELCFFEEKKDKEYVVHTEYNKAKDVIKYNALLSNSFVLNTENFVIYYPNDIHQPSVKIDDEEIVKLVIKVKI